MGDLGQTYDSIQTLKHYLSNPEEQIVLYVGICLTQTITHCQGFDKNKFQERKMEQAFIMIKPNGVQRGVVSEIISRFEKQGFSLKGLKFLNMDQPFAEKQYADLPTKPFFNGLVEYITSSPVVAMIWEGNKVVTTGQKIIKTTSAIDFTPGTIHGDFAVEVGRNVIYGSDLVESARNEISLWFPDGPTNWTSSINPWIYE